MANQMFIYATAFSAAKKSGAGYCLSEIRDLKYFKLANHERCVNKMKYLFFRLSNKLFHNYQCLHLQDNFKDYCATVCSSGNNCWFYGYFQGERYFNGHEKEIRDRFKIKEKYQKAYYHWYNQQQFNKIIIAVHVRRKDYKTFDMKELSGPDMTLPLSYYEKALAGYINNPDYSIVFLSDDIPTVKNEFSYVKNAVFSTNSAIVDLQILINADLLVLANSSFSWWGAWLNLKPDTKIVVPKYFLGFKVKKEYPINMIPENWTQIEVYE